VGTQEEIFLSQMAEKTFYENGVVTYGPSEGSFWHKEEGSGGNMLRDRILGGEEVGVAGEEVGIALLKKSA